MDSKYDNVVIDILLLIKKLREKNCPHKIWAIIQNWIYEREAHFIMGDGQVKVRKVWKGIPQGAVLSLTLSAIYTEDVGNNLNNMVKLQKFADE